MTIFDTALPFDLVGVLNDELLADSWPTAMRCESGLVTAAGS